MTQEEVLVYYIRKGCVVTPDDMISGVYGKKEGSFADKIAFIFHCTDMILFETGTYSFTGKPMFNFSLVRQFPNDEEEYYQIHVDVLYIPTEENKDFQRTIWNEDIEEDIFSYIKKTPEFNSCKDKVFSKIEIYLDET